MNNAVATDVPTISGHVDGRRVCCDCKSTYNLPRRRCSVGTGPADHPVL